jgi:hypothetical protein
MDLDPKRLMVCMLAVLAVGGVATASASAAPEYYINKVKLTFTETVTARQDGISHVLGTLNGSAVLIDCTGGRGTGTIEPAGKSTESDILEDCTMDAPSGCKLTAAEGKELTPVALVDVLGGTSGAFTDSFSPASGTEFLAIAFEKCTSTLNNGSHVVSGCVAAKASEAEQVTETREFPATVSGCALSLAGNAATYTATWLIELSGANKGKTFGIDQ